MNGESRRLPRAGGGSIHYRLCGRGDRPLVLLHGWPHTGHAWREVVPLLEASFRIVVPDLRGLGDSDYAGDDFAKRSIAGDVAAAMQATFGDGVAATVVGHDWGGPVAAALAFFHPQRVARLMIVDVVLPGDGRAAGMGQGGRRWHHAFHQTPGLPEALTVGRERTYLDWFFGEFSHGGAARQPEALDEYERCYAKPGGMRNGFEYYRAMARDAEDNARWLAEHGALAIPVHCVSGSTGRGRGGETLESLSRFAPHATGCVIPECGHCVPEEKPRELAEEIRRFAA